jgi:hypothetical protein
MIMSKEKNPSNFGVMIILIGIAIMLYNLNVLRFSMFWGIVKLWPLLLVVAGLSIIFKRVRYINIILWLLFIGTVIAYSYLYKDEQTWFFGDAVPMVEYSEIMKTDQGELIIDGTVGEVSFRAQDGDGLRYSIAEHETEQTMLTQDALTILKLEDQHKNMGFFQSKNFDISVPSETKWYLDIDGGVMSINLTLEEVMTTGAHIDFGVGDVKMTLGDATGIYDINMGIGDIEIDIPEHIGVKVTHDGGLVSFNTPGYDKINGDYYSSNYDTAEMVVEIRLDLGIGNIDIN